MNEMHDMDDFDARADALFRELSDQTFDAVHPIPPSEVRRLGDRRRTRRRVGVAAAALGVSLVAGTGFALTRPDMSPHQVDAAAPSVASPSPSSKPSLPVVESTPSQIATTANPSPSATESPEDTEGPSPSATSQATRTPQTTELASPTASVASPSAATGPAPITTALLPGTDLIYWNTPGDLHQTAQYEGNGPWKTRHSPLSYCEDNPDALGQRNVVWREFSGEGSGFTTVAILDFDSEGKATAARQTVRDWFKTCLARQITPSGKVGSVSPAVQLNVDGPHLAGVTVDASHRQVKYADKGAQDSMWEDVTVISAKNRLMVVDHQVYAPDLNCVALSGQDAPQCSTPAKASALADRLAG